MSQAGGGFSREKTKMWETCLGTAEVTGGVREAAGWEGSVSEVVEAVAEEFWVEGCCWSGGTVLRDARMKTRFS